jgi:putative acyl-CoA dehydrogenase
MEALGGNGYIEEHPLPRFYREAPVNSIWEGSGNVVCLDIPRAMRREPEAVDALLEVLQGARGANAHFDRHVARVERALRTTEVAPGDERRLAQAIALSVAAGELVRHAPALIADAYCASRLADDAPGGATFGVLPAGIDADAVLARTLP